MRNRVAICVLFAASVWPGCNCGRDLETYDDGGAPDMPPLARPCNGVDLVGVCFVGHCRLSAPAETIREGDAIELAELPLPVELVGDSAAPYLCSVRVPDGVQLTARMSLTMDLDPPVDARVTLFRWAPPSPAIRVPSSAPSMSAIQALLDDGGDFGAALRPGPWSVEGVAGTDVTSSAGDASFLRNLSNSGFQSAFYDGTRLFVGNGNRILIWNGLPRGPFQRPDVVLGQLDLDTRLQGTTSSLLGASVNGLFSDGNRLYASTGNRVLIWTSSPTSNFRPADLVLGQNDFNSNAPNSGGVSGSSLSTPFEIDSDGTHLTVADRQNHRVLVWSSPPSFIAQPADRVVGQATFLTNAVNGGATPLYQASGVLLDGAGLFVGGTFQGNGLSHVASLAANNPSTDFVVCSQSSKTTPDNLVNPTGIARLGTGGIAVRDAASGRIGVFRGSPTSARPLDFVLGQPDATRSIFGMPTASTVGSDYVLSSHASPLVAIDANRLLIWDRDPDYDFEPASRVVGQAGFASNERGVDYRGISANTLAAPSDVAVRGTTIAVADRANNRVLLYRTADIGNSRVDATVVVGQPDMASYVPNLDQLTPSAARLSAPGGVALDGIRLIVADTENHRVLVWSTLPQQNGTPASLVLGQADFTGVRPNRGRADASPRDGRSDAAADGFFAPTGVASDGTRLFVADRANNRVLVWNTFPTQNGQPADAVLGQAAMNETRANRGNGGLAFVIDGFNLPTGITLATDTLWVSDTENNRVVAWNVAAGGPSTPTVVLGQPDGSSVTNPNYYPAGSPNQGLALSSFITGAGTIVRPRSVAVFAGRLYVSELESNRVHVFDAGSRAHLAVLGQSDVTTGAANAGGIRAASLAAPQGLATDGSRLYVADSGNHRISIFDLSAPLANGVAASAFLGQPSPVSNGFNLASAARGGVVRGPRGLHRDGNQIFVADSQNHRVLLNALPLVAGVPPMRVYGQPDDGLALPNSGGVASARSLNSPRGVFADSANLVIADTGNHRVLIFDCASTSPDARLVLGQADFTSSQGNRGGTAAAGTMLAPEGAWMHNGMLYVADTGNHRVLGWTSMPAQNGQAADFVLGQDNMTAAMPNRGQQTCSASTLAFPSGVRIVGGALYLADSGNNRVLRFATAPTSGAAADGVIGQGDFKSRTSAATPTDFGRLGGPVALTDDGSFLYVLDRDLARIVAWRLDRGGGQADAIFGPTGGGSGLAVEAPGGLAAERTSAFTTRLYVSDTSGSRVLVLGSVARLVDP